MMGKEQKKFMGEGARGRQPRSLALPPENPLPEDDAIINPRREAREAPVCERAILTFARPDYYLLCRLTQVAAPPRYIWDCAVREGRWHNRPITLVAPAPGAPYAVLVLEKLIALGARMVVALGWCGSLSSHLGIGSLLLPTAAVAGDGTSGHYLLEASDPEPDHGLYDLLARQLKATAVNWHSGPVWTTDAFYRETVSLVRQCQARGILAVDLELAALLAVGQYRRVPVASLLVVSDELADLRWRPGYRAARFREARNLAARLVLAAAAQWGGSHV